MLGRIVETQGGFHLYRQNEREQVGDQGIVNEFSFSKTIRAGSREVKMKKMMLGLAASLCVAVTFADGVESANVVG